MKNTNIIRNFWLSAFALLLVASLNSSAQVIRKATADNPGGLNWGVLLFSNDLGGSYNGVGQSYTTGYREITWDDVPDNLAEPYHYDFPSDYYNTTSPRGAIISSQQEDWAGHPSMSVSARAATGNLPLFRNYHSDFMAYSGERIFGAMMLPGIDIVFRVPGTDIPASVNGFGVVLTDIDYSGSAYISLYDEKGKLLKTLVPQQKNAGLSFIGATFTDGRRIARAHIRFGGLGLEYGNDYDYLKEVVAIDNVIYGEPRPIEHHPSDFDGDGAKDYAVFRPSDGNWHILSSGTNTYRAVKFGAPNDIPVDGDFDGDSRSDITVFRPSTGIWYSLRSSDEQVKSVQWGASGDNPSPGDYDRDGLTDFAVWRPSSGSYYVLRSSDAQMQTVNWGASGDIPIGTSGF